MFFKGKSKKPGMSPGTLVYVGDKKEEKVKITIIDYTPDHMEEKEVETVEACLPYLESESVTWINISGVHDLSVIEQLGTHFNMHPLVLEDLVNTDQRPKMDDYEDYLFLVLKMLHIPEKELSVEVEQLSLIVTPKAVISLLEYKEDVFEPVRERIRKSKGRIRRKGADYLTYALIDTVVDHYFGIFESIGERLEQLEEAVLEDPKPETLHEIHALKREMIFIRRSVWPLREIVNTLVRGDSTLISDGVEIFLRDVYDHTIQVIDMVETSRDMLSGMQDIYLSSVSNKMNEVMKVLTIIATIFIPMTFLAGLYGMNFKHMPELELPWAYPVFWGVLIVIFGSMLTFFRRKRWL